MYVILTSKVGEFRTDAGAGVDPVETYDYLYCGRAKANFVIARLDAEAKIRIEDETPPPVVNYVSTKFLPKYETVEQARLELEHLASFGGEQTALVRVDR